MFRDIFWMGLSSAIRLATGLLLFILIARHLGPVEFGHYMFWFNITFLCSLLANYGLSNMLLKEIAQHPESVTDALNTSLSLRLFLSVSVFICALIISIMVDRPHLLLILLLVHFADVISETLYVAYRALGHYARESQLAAYAAIIQLVFIAVAVITNQNTEVVAFAHFIGKAAQLALILPISRRTFGKFSLQSVSTAFRLARRTIAYAVDNAMGCSFGHIDSAMLRVFTNIDVVGIYQSGMRIFQGGSQAGPILANVFLPEIARQMQRKEKSSHALLALQATFLLYGLIFGLVLTYFSEQIVYFAFGENYKHLASLLPFFWVAFFHSFYCYRMGRNTDCGRASRVSSNIISPPLAIYTICR
jgi:O-antigen/teichoic acid export membrane protein